MSQTTTVELSAGPLRVHDTGGDGPVVVLAHGALVDHRLWDGVVAQLAPGHRCVAPDLPLGSHTLALRDAAGATPEGVARMIEELLEALDLRDVTLAGNDTGGALCQLVAARRPPRVGRLLLTSCDAFDHFPPLVLRPFKAIAHVPGGIAATARVAGPRAVRRSPLGYGLLTREPLDDALTASWLEPARADAGVRRDLATLLRGMRPQLTRDAAAALRGFDRPAIVAWGERDAVFPRSDGRRLAEILGASFELLPGARTFTPVDAPERLAELVRDLARVGTA